MPASARGGAARLLAAGCALGVALSAGEPAAAQRRALTARDSALVRRILLAEDRRDRRDTSAALAEGARHADDRVRLLARRAAARVRDTLFAARDSFPAPPAPPAYPDPAWRLRLRALAQADCTALRAALGDSAWHVRLRAAALAKPECAGDAALVRTLVAWAGSPPASAARRRGGASWHPAAHALVALARIAPDSARRLLPGAADSPVSWLRVYAARAAGALGDTTTLRRLARDADDNVKEAAIDSLAARAGHAADDVYIDALSARGYQAVRAAARALAGSPRRREVFSAALAAGRRLRADSSQTSRDARLALIDLLGEFGEFGRQSDQNAVADLAHDFDCVVARAAAVAAVRIGPGAVGARCTPIPVTLPPDAAALALGREAHLRVALADSSGGGSFTVRLRGDVAPVMSARVLALARSGYYDGLSWHRVQPDFVIQGGGPGANEYVGHPRFIRDELHRIAHPRGTLGMSTRGHDTGDAQWFVNLRDNPRLVRAYTVFAEVVDGIEVVDGVMEGDVIARIEVVGR